VAILGTSPFLTAMAMACSLGIVQAAQKRAPVQVIFNFGSQLLAIPLYYAALVSWFSRMRSSPCGASSATC